MENRAEAIGRLWQVTDGSAVAELLIDLEQDRLLALDLANALKDSVRKG